MFLARSGQACARPSCQTRQCAARPSIRTQRLRPLAATGNGDNAEGSKPRRRSSSKNPSNSDIPPPAVQLANNMASSGNSSGNSSGSGSGSKGGTGKGSNNTPSPAVQLANNMASGSKSSSSGGGGGSSTSKGSGGSAPTPSPAVQIANNLSTGSSTTPASPAAQVASNMANTQQGTAPPAGSSSSSSQTGVEFNPADLIQQGVRAAADTAENALVNTAAAAVGGVEAAASLTQSGINAAESAAEDTVRNINAAAQGTLNAAAAAAGTAAGVVDGVGQSVARGSSSGRRGNNGSGVMSSSDFETVNVRVPSTAWANATPEKGRVRDNTLTQDFDEDEVENMKVQILAAVASLDRGLAANVREARDVDRLARKLEDAIGPITLKWTTSRSSPDKSTMDRLAGTWRLIYSSGFNGGSLGGSRPGPPAAFVPTILGQVYQVINAQTMTLDNVVELLLNYGVPQLPFLPRPDPQPSPGLRLSLHHTYEVTPPNTVKIVFESTSAKAIGPDILQGLPELGVPELPSFLKPPKNFRSATFDVTYLDRSMRITRGDRGELRIYLRDRPLTPSLPMDDIDRDYE